MNLTKNLKSNIKAVSSLVAELAVIAAQRLDVAARRAEMFNKISALSSNVFAQAIQEETKAEKNVYDIEKEIEIQEEVCELLSRGVEPSIVLEAAENKIVGALLKALDMKRFDGE